MDVKKAITILSGRVDELERIVKYATIDVEEFKELEQKKDPEENVKQDKYVMEGCVMHLQKEDENKKAIDALLAELEKKTQEIRDMSQDIDSVLDVSDDDVSIATEQAEQALCDADISNVDVVKIHTGCKDCTKKKFKEWKKQEKVKKKMVKQAQAELKNKQKNDVVTERRKIVERLERLKCKNI